MIPSSRWILIQKYKLGHVASLTIAGTQKLVENADNFTWMSWSDSEEEEEVDSLEQFFNRKRIKYIISGLIEFRGAKEFLDVEKSKFDQMFDQLLGQMDYKVHFY